MEQLLTAPEAADYLRQAASTLATWRVNGVGPKYVRLGRRVLYRASDLAAYVDELAEGRA